MRARAWIATVAWIALAHPASGAVDLLSWSHEVVELPHDGSPFSILTDLNDANIGAGNLTGPFGTAATLWTPRPCPPDCVPLVFDRHPLPEMAGTSDFVTGISNLGPGGTVAVSAARLDDATGAPTPIVFTFLAATPSTVSAVPLPLPDGFAQGSAQDVNARGDVVGWVDTAAADSQQAVFWDFDGSTYTPVLLPATDAFAISDDGPVGATAGSEVRLFPDPTLDPMDFAPLDGGSPFVQLFDLGEANAANRTGGVFGAGLTTEFAGGFEEPILFLDPVANPDSFALIQSTPPAVATTTDSTGQTLIASSRLGYTAPGLDPARHAACAHDTASFDLGSCDFAQLVGVAALAEAFAVAINERGVVGLNQPDGDDLRGTIVQPRVPVVGVTDLFDFGTVPTGDSTSLTGELTNQGAVPLQVSGISVFPPGSDFSIGNLLVLPATVDPGTTLPFDVGFAPGREGAQTAQLTLSSNDPLDPERSFLAFGLGGPRASSCDFDGNGLCDVDDIDALTQEIAAGTSDPRFDLTDDGIVDQGDLDEWLRQAGAENNPSGSPYLKGDANLDGVVDGQDFIVWNAKKFTETARWSQGDFNADGFNDGQDFIEWNGNKFTSSGGSAPSPAAAGARGPGAEPSFELDPATGVLRVDPAGQRLQSIVLRSEAPLELLDGGGPFPTAQGLDQVIQVGDPLRTLTWDAQVFNQRQQWILLTDDALQGITEAGAIARFAPDAFDGGPSAGEVEYTTFVPAGPSRRVQTSVSVQLDDDDGDGIGAADDNCLDTPNPDQLDSDADGFGNACDPDYNNDGAVGIPDFNAIRALFGTTSADAGFDPAVDHNGDGAIGIPDFNVFRSFFGGAPGPSGLACAGTVPCP